MTVEIAQAFYVDESGTVSFAQLVQRSGLSEAELTDLIDCGALAAAPSAPTLYSERCVVVARTARRLRDEYALEDSHTLAVVVRLTQRLEDLEAQVRDLRKRG